MSFIFGRFVKRGCSTPRIVESTALISSDARVGDLVRLIGGCPRFPGDRCDLVGGYTSVVCEYKGELFYKIIP